ncbi:MAG: ribonuclease III [Bacteriovoracales bacterium]|nr:ribonuclease III [Bacteriovoracales bacterium]
MEIFETQKWGQSLGAWGIGQIEGRQESLDLDFFPRHPQVLELEEKISHGFSRHRILFQALCHRSFVHELACPLPSNERLEFLGDSLLETLVTDELFRRYEDFEEGKLSKLRSALVSEVALVPVARFLGLENLVLLGKGEFYRKGDKSTSILADTFEALVAAVYLDSSLERCLQCIKKLLLQCDPHFFAKERLLGFDAKTRLQELCVEYYKSLPDYRCVEFKNGERVGFDVEVFIKGRSVARLQGPSKKKVQKELAERVLKDHAHALFPKAFEKEGGPHAS